MRAAFTIEQAGVNDLELCPCCRNSSRTVWGYVYSEQGATAAYFVHWTLGKVRDYGANVDLIVGAWGEGATASQRKAISMVYRVTDTGPWVGVINAQTRGVARNPLVGRALARDEVIGTPLATEGFAIFDAIWLQDDRIIDLRIAAARPPSSILNTWSDTKPH